MNFFSRKFEFNSRNGKNWYVSRKYFYWMEFKLWWSFDPGDDAHLIIDVIERNSITPKAIINTHAHLDHIGAVQHLKEKYKIPFYLHTNEKMILEMYEASCKMFGIVSNPRPEVDIWFKNEGELIIDKFRFNTLNTPGHTPGGTCLQIQNHIFVGDTIFRGSVGRTDLPGGDSTLL